jgi:hypothetical protein
MLTFAPPAEGITVRYCSEATVGVSMRGCRAVVEVALGLGGDACAFWELRSKSSKYFDRGGLADSVPWRCCADSLAAT